MTGAILGLVVLVFFVLLIVVLKVSGHLGDS